MKSLILNFFLLMLKISLNLSPNTNYKYSGFSKTLLKKTFKFVLSKKNDIIIFNLSLILMLTKFNLILEKQSYKKDALIAYATDYIKIVLPLSTKIIALYK